MLACISGISLLLVPFRIVCIHLNTHCIHGAQMDAEQVACGAKHTLVLCYELEASDAESGSEGADSADGANDADADADNAPAADDAAEGQGPLLIAPFMPTPFV